MSLINRMLEDLDARQSQGGAARRGRLSRRGSTALPWIVAGVSLTLAVAITVAWFAQKSPLVNAAQVDAAVASAPATDNPGHANPDEPADVQTNKQSSVQPLAAIEPPEENTIPKQQAADVPANGTVAAGNSPPGKTSDERASETDTASGSGVVAAGQDNTSEPVTATTADATRPSGHADKQVATASAEPAYEGEGELQISRHLPKPEDAAREQINNGLRAMRARDYELASTRLAAGLEVLSGNDQAREALYVAYRRQGRIAEAEGVLRDGLALADEPARFAKLLARELAARDARTEALQVLAIEIPPVTRDPEYHALRGALLQQEARYADALPVYEGLVRHYPDNSTWLAGLGMAQEQTGNLVGARNSYTRALQAGALTATVQEYVQSRLAALQAATASGE